MEDFEAPAIPEAKDTLMPKAVSAAPDKKPFEHWHSQKAPEWLPEVAVQLQAGWPGAGYEVTEDEYAAALTDLMGSAIGYRKVGTR